MAQECELSLPQELGAGLLFVSGCFVGNAPRLNPKPRNLGFRV